MLSTAPPLDEYKLLALLKGGNEGLVLLPGGTVALVRDGEYSIITSSTEGQKLHWQLACGKHMRWCTPHAVKIEADLMCRYCTNRNKLKSLGKVAPTKYEARMHSIFDGMGWQARWRPQVQVGCWPHPVHFMIMPECVLVQVDGEGHFCKSMYGTPTAAQQQIDVSMNASAWRMGHALLRVHYRDLKSESMPSLLSPVVSHRQRITTEPLLVLSASYSMHTLSHARAPAAAAEYMAALQAQLPKVGVRLDADHNAWLQPNM